MSVPRISSLITFLSLVLTVLASPLMQERGTPKCTSRDIAIVRRTVSDETYFCKWWLSDARTRSPFLEFTQTQVTDLCKCITSASTSKPKREEQEAEHALEKRATRASCQAEVGVQFTEPYHFCSFYNAYPRKTSPFAKYSAQQLITLCKCAIAGPTSTSVPFCSAQSSLFSGKPSQLSQASNYCSSLLRPTVSAVKTTTQISTVTKTQTRSTWVSTRISTITRSTVLSKVKVETVIENVVAQSTLNQTSNVIEFVTTTNLGTLSVQTDTETATSTIKLAATGDSATTTIEFYARAMASTPALALSVWKTVPPAQATQACNCFVKSASLVPATVYTSTKTVVKPVTAIVPINAQSSRVVLVTLISTINRISTARSTITSTVRTAVQTQTVRGTLEATLTTSIDTLSTSTSQILSIVTYTCPSLAMITPTTTVRATSWSTITETHTTILPKITSTTSSIYDYTITVTSLTTAPTCTYADFEDIVRRAASTADAPVLTPAIAERPAIIFNEPVIFKTVSVCPPTSTQTFTVTATDTSFVTTTLTQTSFSTSTWTDVFEYMETTTTVTSTITPACSTSTIYQVTASATPTSVCDTSYTDTSISPSLNYRISCTIDYTTGPMIRRVTSSLNACIQACSRTSSTCLAAVWVEQGQDYQWCYFKGSSDIPNPVLFPTSIVAYSATRTNLQEQDV